MRTLRNNARYTMSFLYPEPKEIPEDAFNEALARKLSSDSDDLKHAMNRHHLTYTHLADLVALCHGGVRDSNAILDAAQDLSDAIIEELERFVKQDFGYAG